MSQPPDPKGSTSGRTFDDLVALAARIAHLPAADRDAAIERFCQEHPGEDREALRRELDAASRSTPRDHVQLLAAAEERVRHVKNRSAVARYSLRGEVARGGMGVILKAYDEDLGRNLAMKVILGQDAGVGSGTPPVAEDLLARFLDEAQITGQLDHPGVVPVHELGIDDAGRVYFTMRLVKGRTADEVFALARAAKEGWTLTRALDVVLKVCDTLAYAHDKGVIHRDLKPTNVMVGRFGEVYVMDWGLARVTGRDDARDLRVRTQRDGDPSRVHTGRPTLGDGTDSPLVTMDGAVVGTPSYMAPEQAQGRVAELDERSDVYAVGACLYNLITGWQPYLEPGTRASPYTILNAVREGPPRPIHSIDRTIPAPLVAICEKAMARDKQARYASMAVMAQDLRAYLEDRVVAAHRTGPWAELRAWIRRNRTLAATIALAIAGTTLGFGLAWQQARMAHERTLDALAAWSLDTFVRETPLPPAPASGQVRYRRLQNSSPLGGSILETDYVGPRTRIAFVLRIVYLMPNDPLSAQPTETTVFELDYGSVPTETGAMSPPLASRRQVYFLRLERLDDTRETVACLRFLDPDESLRLGSFGQRTRRIACPEWATVGNTIDLDYRVGRDDEDLEIVRAELNDGEQSMRMSIVARFRD